jgi:hypothetical protein
MRAVTFPFRLIIELLIIILEKLLELLGDRILRRK